MKRSENGKALFYSRDSLGKHETTPGEYVKWAIRKAEEFKLRFRGTPTEIQRMIQDGLSSSRDLFLDYGISGNCLVREGLDALIREAKRDPEVSHILIPRRDRLARPDDPNDAVQIENELRKLGITLVFMDQVIPPLKAGRRAELAHSIMAYIEYDQAGRFRYDLAKKMLYAQLSLANDGYSTGGTAPFGFRRWLVTAEGKQIRQLDHGEIVRKSGHHVVWLPGPDEEIQLILRIRDMLKTLPAIQVADILTEEGIPSPNAGKMRTDNGVRHLVSGRWNPTTIIYIARNPLLVALVQYGTRSMGDQLRFNKNGPRQLEDEDYRKDEKDKPKPKVVRNPETDRIRARARFEPLVDAEDNLELMAILDKRAGTQRGKPRSKNPSQNPLGCRVFDMNCSWPMYRVRYQKSFRYTCGLYQQSHCKNCDHNHVDGVAATNFAMRLIQQRVVSHQQLEKLRERFLSFAKRDQLESKGLKELIQKETAFAQLEKDLDRVGRNLAMADTPAQLQAIAKVFAELEKQKESLYREIVAAKSQMQQIRNIDSEISAAMAFASRLSQLTSLPEGLKSATEAIRLADFKLYLKFKRVAVGKRTLNRISGGIATIGAAGPPIELYNGRTDRKFVKNSDPAADTVGSLIHESNNLTNESSPDQEGNSSGNVNRDDGI